MRTAQPLPRAYVPVGVLPCWPVLFATQSRGCHQELSSIVSPSMWLIDTNQLSLRQVGYQADEAASGAGYGILSHRWEEEGEPKFEDYLLNRDSCPKIGTLKIEKCCEVARSHGVEMIWADTCCIDKRSSAELQEAINSMYRYYERATICYVYLRDVSVHTFHDSFIKSEWFTRGWTLQELLAPNDLRFYDCDWNFLGNKKELSSLIFTATGIQEDVLIGKRQLRECSVAQRMSWAARRVTTRVEDIAYSLLGLFDVNMNMLYGEGLKSFLRLQEEIIKTLDDHSIFVWKGLERGLPGLLAPSPKAFAFSGNVRNVRDRKGRRPYIVNNRGTHGLFPLIPYTLETYLTLLPCTRQDPDRGNAQVGIFLRRLYEDDQYMRVSVHGEEVMEDATAWVIQHGVDRLVVARNISVRQRSLLPQEMEHAYVDRIQGFRLNEGLLKQDATSAPLFSISGAWNPETRIVSLPPGSRKFHHVGSINIGGQNLEIETIRFGFDHDYNPVVYLTQKNVLYTEVEDHRGVFMESFKHASKDEKTLRLLPSGENFQSGALAIGGKWARYTPSSGGTWDAHMSAEVDGFWAIRVDRLEDLDVYINQGAQQPLKNSRDRRIGRLRIWRQIVNEQLVWYLQLDELADRKEYQRNEEVPDTHMDDGNAFWNDVKHLTSRIDGSSFESNYA